MKRAYSEYVYDRSELDALKKLGVDAYKDNVYARYQIMPNPPPDALWTAKVATMMRITESFAITGDCLHLFFHGVDFDKWLIESTPGLMVESCQMAYEFCGFPQGPRNAANIMLHFQGGNSPCLLVAVPWNGEMIIASRGGKNGWVDACSRIDPRDMPDNQKLVTGALAYCNAFPDQMHEGLPDDLKGPNHFKNQRCVGVSVAPRLIVDRNGPHPHYRIGHYRLLRSSFYVNSRGKTIFVDGTYVKGRVMTIEDIK